VLASDAGPSSAIAEMDDEIAKSGFKNNPDLPNLEMVTSNDVYDWNSIRNVFGGCGNQPDWKFTSWSRLSTVPLTKAGIERMVSDLGAPACQSPWLNLLIDNYGGAIADTPIDGTAFPHRNALFQLQYNIYWNDYSNNGSTPLSDMGVDGTANGEACVDFLDTAYHNMAPHFADSAIPNAAYRNYPNSALKNWQQAYWGGNYARLQQLKKVYDPYGIFQYTQSVEMPNAEL
jgi:hypothetical protein